VGAVRVISVVGARPQFIKAATVSRALAALGDGAPGARIRERLVHTGQHYDPRMSRVFFEELKVPRPVANLGVGSGPHGWQTAEMLQRLEPLLTADRPDWVVVYGDTNSTLAAALAAAKLHLSIAHVEAGLRSFDRRMPEEVNRILADRVSSLLLCPTAAAVANLAREGITEGVHRVGDVMCDSLRLNAALAEQSSTAPARLGLEARAYYLATVHRAENTDDPVRLAGIISALGRLGRPVVLPVHPRTRRALAAARAAAAGGLRPIEPVSYLDMIALERSARLILTDSGGVQKEAYWLGVPCVTLRDETEWVELVACGCNRLAGADAERIAAAVDAFEAEGAVLPAGRPKDLYGDGHSAERIAELLAAGH
jgi:UDP-N-acetylglucosamine 2-epimerase